MKRALEYDDDDENDYHGVSDLLQATFENAVAFIKQKVQELGSVNVRLIRRSLNNKRRKIAKRSFTLECVRELCSAADLVTIGGTADNFAFRPVSAAPGKGYERSLRPDLVGKRSAWIRDDAKTYTAFIENALAFTGYTWLTARELADRYVDHAYDERFGRVPAPEVRRQAMTRISQALIVLVKDGAVEKREIIDPEVMKERPGVENKRDSYVYKGTPYNSARWQREDAKRRYNERVKREQENKLEEQRRAAAAAEAEKLPDSVDPLVAAAIREPLPAPAPPDAVKGPDSVLTPLGKLALRTKNRRDRDSLTKRVRDVLRTDDREWLTLDEIYYCIEYDARDDPVPGHPDVTFEKVENAVHGLVRKRQIMALGVGDAVAWKYRPELASEWKLFKKVYKIGTRDVDAD